MTHSHLSSPPTLHAKLRLIAAFLALAAISPAAKGLSFSFFQDGFEDGATITGSFAGEDLNDDGILSYFDLSGPTELTSFTLSFSGNGVVETFSLDLSHLSYFVYYLGDNILGNDVSADPWSLDFEGIVALDSQYTYSAGQGPTFTDWSFIDGPFASTISENPIVISPSHRVPDAGSSALLLGIALAALATGRRNASNTALKR